MNVILQIGTLTLILALGFKPLMGVTLIAAALYVGRGVARVFTNSPG